VKCDPESKRFPALHAPEGTENAPEGLPFGCERVPTWAAARCPPDGLPTCGLTPSPGIGGGLRYLRGVKAKSRIQIRKKGADGEGTYAVSPHGRETDHGIMYKTAPQSRQPHYNSVCEVGQKKGGPGFKSPGGLVVAPLVATFPAGVISAIVALPFVAAL